MSIFQKRFLFNNVNAWRASLILAATVASLAAGWFCLVYPSPYSPLAVIAATVAVAIGIAWLGHPVWALYGAVFVVLLPIGLIPSNIHSILNRSVTMAALSIWLFDVLVRRRSIQWTITATFMLGFIVWSMVSLFWTDSLSMGITSLQTLGLRFILFFLITNEISTRRTLNGLMNTLALTGWVLMAVGLGTVVIEGYAPGTRLKVLGMNENEVGIIALVAMIGILWQALQPSQRRQRLTKLASWPFLLGTIALVAASGSRGSAISLLITLLAFCFWKPTRPWGTVGLLVLALGIILVPFLFMTTLERFFAGNPHETLLSGREALWQAAIKLIIDHPLSGVGIGNSSYALLPYLVSYRGVLGLEKAAVHNPVLVIWADTGLPGILLYLSILASAIWLFIRQFSLYHRAGVNVFLLYFALVSSTFLGYMTSWIKGGGMELTHTYFLMLSLLIIPFHLRVEENSLQLT
jgi:putative inorganic carbon (HCO3(-)) transporter